MDTRVYKSDSLGAYPVDADLLAAIDACGAGNVESDEARALYAQWNHLWLLRVIWMHLAAAFRDGTRRGAQVTKLLERVQRLYAHAPKSFALTFHMTLLYFWVQLSDYCLRVSDVEGHDAVVYRDLLAFWRAHPWLLNDQLFTQYYSPKLVLHTPQSLQEFMLPDVKPLPSIVAFKKQADK